MLSLKSKRSENKKPPFQHHKNVEMRKEKDSRWTAFVLVEAVRSRNKPKCAKLINIDGLSPSRKPVCVLAI